MAARALSADAEPRVREPIVIDAPAPAELPSTTGSRPEEPTIVPPPTVGPSAPAPVAPPGDDGGGDDDRDDGDSDGGGDD